MEATEETMDIGHGDLGPVVKGKRTKRQRQSPAPALGSSSSDERLLSSPATTTSTGDKFGDSTEEDEDMANCLILLAQSGRRDGPCPNSATEQRATGRRGELYECKTCNKCFSSFQALGGHRASHKKPKTAAAAAVVVVEEEKQRALVAEEEGLGLVLMQQQVGGGAKVGWKGKVHECSICGSEFTSGQALGGHMRRHRAVPESPDSKKPKNMFTLDLNLPAPDDSDDVEFSKFQTRSDFPREQPLVFPALVDCHN